MSETTLRRPKNHTLALPNLLTYGRVIAVPIVVALMMWPEEHWMRWTALGVFSAAAITDFFDGYLARVWQLQSSMGRMLDPIADKLLVAAVLLMLVADHTIESWSIWAARRRIFTPSRQATLLTRPSACTACVSRASSVRWRGISACATARAASWRRPAWRNSARSAVFAKAAAMS